ncbi:MAG: hypothetical protein J1E05_05180 [Eubacterium sp.]|nr:hypothetical protein [Eubacterium sp.]
MKITDYLNQHMIVKIGLTLPEYVCCEIIVDNPKELVPIVRENGCYITAVYWWDRAEIDSGSIIGYGGPRDPRSPNSHFFAETDICRVFNTILQDEEYYKYFDKIKQTYSSYDLFPAFDIKNLKNTQGTVLKHTGDGSMC